MAAVTSTAITASVNPLLWAVQSRTLRGESECGDAYVVAPFPQGVLLAAIDGLGHGPEAANAAQIASETLENHAGEPVGDLVKRCHKVLHKTRGAALSVASLNTVGDMMAWVGVGNVEAMMLRADGTREALSLRSGVVGYQIPSLRVVSLPILPGDLLIFVTDGIDGAFSQDIQPGESPDIVAANILSLYAKETDDALTLVARYLGMQK